jgi:hypothetical protein
MNGVENKRTGRVWLPRPQRFLPKTTNNICLAQWNNEHYKSSLTVINRLATNVGPIKTEKK